jgi:hypothetical protein
MRLTPLGPSISGALAWQTAEAEPIRIANTQNRIIRHCERRQFKFYEPGRIAKVDWLIAMLLLIADSAIFMISYPAKRRPGAIP